MTDDLLAVVDGAKAGGATEIVVVDGHAGMRNVLFDDMPDGVVLHRGPASGRVNCQVEGLDSSFDAVLCVGYHSMAGTAGLLSHTWHGGVVMALRLNGHAVGELGITAAVAGRFGVPVVFVSGDQVVAAEAGAAIPGISTVVVKESTGRQNARCVAPAAARAMLTAGAAEAIRNRAQVAPVATGSSARVEIDLTHSRHADRIVRFMGDRIDRVGPATVGFEQPGVVEAFRLAWLAVELADMELGAWNR
ncbi:MAG TPA: aminopeptidase [Acidimicrobiaceae bacterium]|nr:aminopeptidase [Acidimicrobiaceae bacterium]